MLKILKCSPLTLARKARTVTSINKGITLDERAAQSPSALLTDVADLGVRVGTGLHALAEVVLPFFVGIAYHHEIATFYETSGWLPYRTAPFQLHFLEHPKDRDEAHSRLSRYYEDSSSDVLQDIEARLEHYDIDREAGAVMREATHAHRAGLYRCACRVLLPEIERVIRTHLLHIEKLIPINEQDIREGLRQRHLKDVVIDSPHDFVLFGIFHKHLFAPIKKTIPGNAFVPNRHASAHGWMAYSSKKEALNAIICADYVFRLVSSLKDPSSAEAQTQD